MEDKAPEAPYLSVTHEQVKATYQAYRDAFKALVIQEDKQAVITAKTADLKEGTPSWLAVQAELSAFNLVLAAHQRALRLAGLDLDEMKSHIELESISLHA
jgi:hypothetical protein